MQYITPWAPIVFVGALCALGPNAQADEPIFNAVERVFGATNVNAITGHGRLSAGVSAQGELTVLTWPNPSFADQLGYVTSSDARARTLPRFGAPEGAGAFFGLLLESASGDQRVTWLRDASDWSIRQDYGDMDGANIHTMYSSDRFGLKVRTVHSIAPKALENTDGEGDALVVEIQIEKTPESPTASAWLLSYGNFSPMPPNYRVPALPVADWGLDGRNDFAGVYEPNRKAILQFHPNDQGIVQAIADLLAPAPLNFGVLNTLDPFAETDALSDIVRSLDTHFSPGAYLLWGTRPAPDQYQVGQDLTDFCSVIDGILDNLLQLATDLPHLDIPLDPNLANVVRCPDEARPPMGNHSPSDAWLDAADGRLMGRAVALGETNAVLRTPLAFEDGISTAHAIFAFGPTAHIAQEAFDTAHENPERIMADAEAATSAWIDPLRLPSTQGEQVRAVARRSLINLRVGTDARTGAIVASISRQPSYGLDWPRDGAFFNIALDIAGARELAEKRAALYDRWQRKDDEAPSLFFDTSVPTDPDTGLADAFPAGGWEMNYFADGMPGGFYRFEIDNTGFALWLIVAHAGWSEYPEIYLRRHWDAIERAANLLTRWRDPITKLQAPAQEDDQANFTQTLHGAITTFGSLELASRAAFLLGEIDAAQRWSMRAEELQAAILEHIWNEETQRFESQSEATWNPGSTASGPTAWAVWPFPLLPYGDPRLDAQLRFDLDQIRPALRLTSEGGAYFMKNTVALALAWGQHPEFGLEIQSISSQLAAQATQETHHFGETMTVLESPDGPYARQQVANPHLWEGTLFYLTAMALEDPSAFFRYDEVLPPSSLQAAPGPNADFLATNDASNTGHRSGCTGCGISTHQDSFFGLVVGLFILRRYAMRGHHRSA